MLHFLIVVLNIIMLSVVIVNVGRLVDTYLGLGWSWVGGHTLHSPGSSGVLKKDKRSNLFW